MNIGNNKVFTVLELVKIFEEVSGCKIDFKYFPKRNGDLASFWADTSKARNLIKWQPKYSVRDACTDTWVWQKQNPNGYCELK